MTACRASVAFAALLALSAGVAAQTAPPAVPPPEATGAPTPLGNPSTDPPPAAEPENTPAEFKPGIFNKASHTGGELGIVDGPPVGILDDNNGGLGRSMWVNAPREEVEDLLSRLPLVSADPFTRSLSRRLVLTLSDTPVGPAKRALVTIRIEKLVQAGLLNEAGALAVSLRLDSDLDFARVQAEAILYAGLDKELCSDLTATRLAAPDPFWLELRTYCFAAAGDTASAELTQAVLDNQAKDPAFNILMNAVLNKKKIAAPVIEKPTALHIYLMRKAGLPITNMLASRLGTAANLLAARDSRNSPADRLSAAARIAQTGAISNAELLAIANAQTYPPELTADPGPASAKLTYLPAQALLRRAIALETRPPQKIELLLGALAGGGRLDRLPTTAVLQNDGVAALKPDAVNGGARFLVARALLLSGKADAASSWYIDAPADMDHAAFAILLDIAATNPSRASGAQAAYQWLAKNAAPQKGPTSQAALALGFADVLERPMPPDAKALAGTLQGMRWSGSRPTAESWRKLAESAAQPGRKGETILRILDLVGADGPADLAPDVAIECVRILLQMGLATEARQLAIETLAMNRPVPAPP